MKIYDKSIQGFALKIIEHDKFILGITKEIGPRILFLAHKDKPNYNLLAILPDAGRFLPNAFWKIYGGHRLWSSPESVPRSYSLDNQPVDIKIQTNKITIIGNPEPENSIQKEIILGFSDKQSIDVIHRIKNMGQWPIELSCWGLSVMRQKGFAMISIKPSKVDKEGLLPDRHLSLWPYSNLSDKRLTFTNDYLFVRQDPKAKDSIKLGVQSNPSWVAYYINGLVFLKKFGVKPGIYPDFGCSVEVYTNAAMLEIETLSPLQSLEPGKTMQHIEHWHLWNIGNLKPDAKSINDKLTKLIH